MRSVTNERDLHGQIAEMRTTYQRLKDHELFLVWFLQATVTEDGATAVNAQTGNSKDKGAEAILIDDPARVAFIVQGKYRQKVNGGAEKRADVISFAQLARDPHGADEDFSCAAKEARL